MPSLYIFIVPLKIIRSCRFLTATIYVCTVILKEFSDTDLQTCLSSESEFLNFEGPQAAIPRNWFYVRNQFRCGIASIPYEETEDFIIVVVICWVWEEGHPYWSTHVQQHKQYGSCRQGIKVGACFNKLTFYETWPSWFLLNSRNRIFFTP